MSTKDYSTKLLGMEDVELENVEENKHEIKLHLCMRRKQQRCPACGAATEKVHDYRTRRIRDLELRGKKALLLYQRRRYVCSACGKRFSERCPFVGRYQRFTHRTTEAIIDWLHRRKSIVDVARDSGTSVSGVNRVLNHLSVPKPQQLPVAISF